MERRIKVRKARLEDFLHLYVILQLREVIQYTGHLSPPSEGNAQKRWEQRLTDPLVHTLVAEVLGKVVGYCRLQQKEGRESHVGEITMVAVHPDWWSKGVGTALTKAALRLADNSLGLKRIRLTVHSDNKVAIHLYRKVGFQVEGRERKATFRDGKYLDTLIMGRIRNAEFARKSEIGK